MEQVVGGDRRHGQRVATLLNGVTVHYCRCGELVLATRWRSHAATHQREHVVWRTSMEVNAAPRDTAYTRLHPAVAKIIAAKPRTQRRRAK